MNGISIPPDALAEIIREKAHPQSEYTSAKNISDWLAEGGRVKQIEELCPQCGKATIVCCYADISWGDPHNYYDNFCHVCVNPGCAYGEHLESRTIVGQEVSSDGVCPFCKRNMFA